MSTRRSNSRLIIKPCTCWWKPIRRGDLWEGVWSYEWTCTRSNYLLFCWEGPLASLVGDNCCASFCTKSFLGRKSIAWLHCRSNSTFFFLVFACFVFNLKLCIFWNTVFFGIDIVKWLIMGLTFLCLRKKGGFI